MSVKQTFAARLKNLREEKGLNQKELAEKVGVSRGTISFYENCERLPDIDVISEIAKYFNVSTDYLIGVSDVKTTDTNIQAICEYTGLSERSVDVLKYHKDNNDTISAINFLIESEISSIYEDLGDAMCDKQLLEQVCRKNDLNKDGFVAASGFECMQILSHIKRYLATNTNLPPKRLSITPNGKLVDLTNTDRKYASDLIVDDLFSVGVVDQGEIIEKVLIDDVTSILKKAKEHYLTLKNIDIKHNKEGGTNGKHNKAQ